METFKTFTSAEADKIREFLNSYENKTLSQDEISTYETSVTEVTYCLFKIIDDAHPPESCGNVVEVHPVSESRDVPMEADEKVLLSSMNNIELRDYLKKPNLSLETKAFINERLGLYKTSCDLYYQINDYVNYKRLLKPYINNLLDKLMFASIFGEYTRFNEVITITGMTHDDKNILKIMKYATNKIRTKVTDLTHTLQCLNTYLL